MTQQPLFDTPEPAPTLNLWALIGMWMMGDIEDWPG